MYGVTVIHHSTGQCWETLGLLLLGLLLGLQAGGTSTEVSGVTLAEMVGLKMLKVSSKQNDCDSVKGSLRGWSVVKGLIRPTWFILCVVHWLIQHLYCVVNTDAETAVLTSWLWINLNKLDGTSEHSEFFPLHFVNKISYHPVINTEGKS